MGTANNSNPYSDDIGIIPRVIQNIFDKIDVCYSENYTLRY
jgi:hypothetical protein